MISYENTGNVDSQTKVGLPSLTTLNIIITHVSYVENATINAY